MSTCGATMPLPAFVELKPGAGRVILIDSARVVWLMNGLGPVARKLRVALRGSVTHRSEKLPAPIGDGSLTPTEADIFQPSPSRPFQMACGPA